MLGGFLAALHAIPVDLVAGLVDVDDDPAAQWLADAIESYRAALAIVPVVMRGRIEAFLAAAPPSGQHELVFSHNDLGIEHVLVDPETAAVTGILDWTDAALVDPAYDFGLLQRDLGRPALDAALANYPADQRGGSSSGRSSTRSAACWRTSPGAMRPVGSPMCARVWRHSTGCSPDARLAGRHQRG